MYFITKETAFHHKNSMAIILHYPYKPELSQINSAESFLLKNL